MPKIKIEKELYEKVKDVSKDAGYSSVEEFVVHLLEREIKPPEAEDSDEEVMDRLKGLGYIS